MKLYLEVTQDELSLPIAVADSYTELALMRGMHRDYVRVYLYKFKKGKVKNKYPRFIVIEVDDEE